MKTVMDAVKYYRGNDLDYRIDAIHFNGAFFPGANTPAMHDFVCDTTQFNDLVSQLETNFGLVTTGHLRLWQRELKSQEARDINERFKELEQPVFTQAMADKNELPPIDSEYLDEDNQLCKALFHFSSFVIGQMLDNPPIQQYPVFSTARNDRVSVIDTRTDKEKAIDEITKEFIGYTSEVISAFEFAYNKWVGE